MFSVTFYHLAGHFVESADKPAFAEADGRRAFFVMHCDNTGTEVAHVHLNSGEVGFTSLN